jgi:signal transduction histidine kinase
LFNDIQEVAGILGIYIDISDRKKSEVELLIAKKEAEAGNHAKSEFIANMSHDIRTPITGMLAMNQKILNLLNDAKIALSQSHLDPKDLLKDLIAIILQDNQLLTGATEELLILCNSILEAVQLESGKMTPQTAIFNIELLVKHTVSLLQPVASDQQIDLSYTIDPALPRYLKGTRLYLDQILLNLVSNALKFTDKGFVTITVKLAPESHPPFKPGNLVLLKL